MLVIMRIMAVNVKYMQDVIKSVLPVLLESYQKCTIGVKGLSYMNAKLPLGCCLTPTHVLCYPLHIECYTHACVLYTHTATPIQLLPDPVPMHRVVSLPCSKL